MLEKLLAVLAALVTAIEANTAAHLSSATAPVVVPATKEPKTTKPKVEPPAEPEKPKEPEITQAMLIEACTPILAAKGENRIKELTKKFNIAKIRDAAGGPQAKEVLQALIDLAKEVSESAV